MSSPFDAKHILFITSSRIGDAVLSLGVLDYLARTYPKAHFTIACGPLVTSFFEGFPCAHQVIALKKQKYHKHWFGLWRQVYKTRFDIVVDLRDSIVSRSVRARKRYIFTNAYKMKDSKVIQNGALLGLDPPPGPRLWFSTAQEKRALELIPDGDVPVLGVGPTANWIGKTWPPERFIEIVRWMTDEGGLMPGARVAVFAAPGEEKNAREVLASVPEERRLDIIAKTDPATAAATIARCNFYIGNDSGLMHCAAAAGVPTFGLFGPSYPEIYRPWGARAAYVSTPESFDALIDYDGYDPKTAPCLMESLSVDMVKDAIKENWPKLTASS